MSRLSAVVLVGVLTGLSACTNVPPDPIQFEHGLLTVDNRTRDDWQGVEIWANRYFRATAASIAAGSRLQVPLNAFVSGYGQRFDPQHVMIRDLRLTAKTARGDTVTLQKEFQKSGLAALGGSK